MHESDRMLLELFAFLDEEGGRLMFVQREKQGFLVSDLDNTTILPLLGRVTNLDDVTLVVTDSGGPEFVIALVGGFREVEAHFG